MHNKDIFPRGQQRKKVIEEFNEKSSNDRRKEVSTKIENREYTWLDSSMEMNSSNPFLDSFEESFEKVLPLDNTILKNYIENTLRNRKGKAIGVEFGGVGSKLFSEFTPGFFKQSVGITIFDHRKNPEIPATSEQQSHTILEGDIFNPDTNIKLNSILKGEKIDLIVERMAAGLELFPHEPYMLSKLLNTWYELLNIGGVMFIQTPVALNNLTEKWITKIQSDFAGRLDVQFKRGLVNGGYPCSAVRIRKLFGAPEKIPLLTPEEVKESSEKRPPISI
jgi:hypothetical protein